MKLPLPAMVLFLFSPPPRRTPLAVIAELCQRPQKKPASLAGFLSLVLTISRFTALSLHPAAPAARPSHTLSPFS